VSGVSALIKQIQITLGEWLTLNEMTRITAICIDDEENVSGRLSNQFPACGLRHTRDDHPDSPVWGLKRFGQRIQS
jgi:hypothetical protein